MICFYHSGYKFMRRPLSCHLKGKSSRFIQINKKQSCSSHQCNSIQIVSKYRNLPNISQLQHRKMLFPIIHNVILHCKFNIYLCFSEKKTKCFRFNRNHLNGRENEAVEKPHNPRITNSYCNHQLCKFSAIREKILRFVDTLNCRRN